MNGQSAGAASESTLICDPTPDTNKLAIFHSLPIGVVMEVSFSGYFVEIQSYQNLTVKPENYY